MSDDNPWLAVGALVVGGIIAGWCLFMAAWTVMHP